MSTLFLVTLVFILLSYLIFKGRSYFFVTGLLTNVLIFIGYLFALSLHLPVYVVTIVSFLLMTCIILFYTNGVNPKTKMAFVCVVIFVISFTIMILPLIFAVKTAGFSMEDMEGIDIYNFNVNVPFTALNVSVIMMSFSGAVVDGSMAISSSTFEIYANQPDLSFKTLFQSSLSVTKEALNSTIYSLLFAFLGSNIAVVIFFQDLNYSFIELINSKLFVGELLVSVLTGISGILVLPFSSLLASWLFVKRKSVKKDA